MSAPAPHPARSVRVLIASFLLLPLVSASLCPAQDVDALLTDTGRRAFTVADQIADPGERKAFVSLYNARKASQRAERAEAFLTRYPRSWVLAQVYEVASKAQIELGNYDRALEYGADSLRLLPENPLLLVSLANVQVRRGLMGEAKQSARSALEYLQRLDRPSSIPKGEWPALKRQLDASCYFVLGRAATSEALALAAGPRQNSLWQDSLGFLVRARGLDPEDPEIAYLMGLNYLALKRRAEAAASFAATYRLNGELKSAALQQLRKIYKDSNRPSTSTFEAYLHSLEARARTPESGKLSEPSGAEVPFPDYVGSQTCRRCHTDIYLAWFQTGMARMFRLYQPQNVIGDFQHDNKFYEGDEVRFEDGKLEGVPGKNRVLFARAVMEQGRHYFEIKQSDGRWHRYPVDYTIGSKWQQAYATKLPNGRIHVFPIQYNALHKEWINFWKIIDTPGSERADIRTWERLDASTSYQENCAACHTSQLRNERGGGFEPDGLVFRELGIDCEMCHGPGGRHVSSILSGKLYKKKPIEPPVDFSQISSRDSVAICAQCHMQSAVREPGPHGELSFSRQGEFFFPRFKSRPYGEFSIQARYKDGRFRQSTFLVESLLRTQCYQKGGATCVSCHNPHPADASTNQTSLKFRDRPNQMCLQCHAELIGKVPAHTRHPLDSEASRCVSCHMPRILDALLFEARSHQMDDIPNADMTLRFGRQDSPNACLDCHHDKDALWLKRQLLARRAASPSS